MTCSAPAKLSLQKVTTNFNDTNIISDNNLPRYYLFSHSDTDYTITVDIVSFIPNNQPLDVVYGVLYLDVFYCYYFYTNEFTKQIFTQEIGINNIINIEIF